MSGLAVGKRVRVIRELRNHSTYTGVIYDHQPDRQWPWHVRLDDTPKDKAGIAFFASELEVIEDEQEVQ